MKRVKRIQPAVRAAGHDERERAVSLAKCERLVADAERRLADLETYRAEYLRGFGRRVAGGISATGLRDYQIFLARLSQAIEAQASVVADVRHARDRALDDWRAAAQRARSIGHVVGRWQAEERAALERREQSETDELAHQRRRTGR